MKVQKPRIKLLFHWLNPPIDTVRDVLLTAMVAQGGAGLAIIAVVAAVKSQSAKPVSIITTPYIFLPLLFHLVLVFVEGVTALSLYDETLERKVLLCSSAVLNLCALGGLIWFLLSALP